MAEYSNIYHVGEVAGTMNAKKVAKDLLGVPGLKNNKKDVNKLAAKIRALNGLKKGETFDAFTGSNKAIAAGENVPTMGYGYALKLPNYQGRQLDMTLGGPTSYIDQYGTFRKAPKGAVPEQAARLRAANKVGSAVPYQPIVGTNSSQDEYLRRMGLA